MTATVDQARGYSGLSIRRADLNTVILVSILVTNTLQNSELGGTGSIFNTITFALAVGFLLLNLKADRFLLAVFGLPLAFFLLSVLANVDTLHLGGFRSAALTTVGYLMLMLKGPPLNREFFEKFIKAYISISVSLSLYYFLAAVTSGIPEVAFRNANFNVNPNSATIHFFFGMLLSLVFLRGRWLWCVVAIYVLLLLTTGSRIGVISTAVLLGGYAMFWHGRYHLFSSKRLLSKRNGRVLLGLVTIVSITVVLLPDDLNISFQRIAERGLALTSDKATGRLGYGVRWRRGLEISISSPEQFLFGSGPSTAVEAIGRTSHSSYVEAFVTVGWPFLIANLIAMGLLCRYHFRRGHENMVVVVVSVMVLGATTKAVFVAMTVLWYLLILVSLYYRSIEDTSKVDHWSPSRVAQVP